MTQGRLTALGLLLLDGVAVVLTFNLVAWLWLRGFGPLHLPIFEPLLLPALLHVLGVHLIDGYNPRTDMMSVTYTSHHTIALFAVLLATLLLVHAVIPAGFTLQTSRFVTTIHHLGRRHPAGTFVVRKPSPMFNRIAEVFGFGA